MIILHRLTPFVISLMSLSVFCLLMFYPRELWFLIILAFLAVPLLFARLLLFEYLRPAFWVFLGTPCLLLVSAVTLFFILDPGLGQWALALVVSIACYLYAENLFAFYHLPSTYQAYSLEYLTLIIYVLSAFFFTGSAYMAQLFLELPMWTPASAVFLSVLLSTMAVFWVSKIGFETGIPYAVVGAIVLTELYIALALLPTSFVTNAAVFSVCLATYFGLVRAHVLEKLTTAVARRHISLALLLLTLIFLTATWL